MVPVEYVVTGGGSRPAKGRRLRRRLVENFFARWPLYILPIILLGAVGVLRAAGVAKEYRSTGSVNVASSTFLSDLTNVNTPSFGYDTPATKTSRDINQRLQSDQFARTVAAAAGISADQPGGDLNFVRSHVFATPSGDNLLQVTSTTGSPELSQQLAKALIDSYTQYVLTAETASSESAATFIQTELDGAKQQVTDAEDALAAYFDAHPSPTIGSRPDVQQLQIQRLNDAITSAQNQVDTYQTKLDEATIATKQSESDITQRLQLVDEPRLPSFPEPVRKTQIMSLAVFLMLGLFIALASLLVVSLLDRSVRSADDLEGISDLEVIASIPRQRTPTRSSMVTALASGNSPEAA